MVAEVEPTHFVNVDLEIGHRRSVDPLVADLGAALFELYRGREIDDLDRVHYQVIRMQSQRSPNATIREFVRVLARLGPAAQRCWRTARVRDFNIGLRAGPKPHSVEYALEPAVVRSVAELGARIVVTVYAPYPPPASKPARKPRAASSRSQRSSTTRQRRRPQ